MQNEPAIISTEEKVELVRLLCKTGVDEVEVSSFVSPKWVPQLGDAEAVFDQLAGGSVDGPTLSALVPNEKGMEGAMAVNGRAGRKLISRVNLFTAASETFSKRNINATIAESFERFRPVVARAAKEGLGVRIYVSCAIACPFEGEISPRKVSEVAAQAVGLLDHSDLWRSLEQPGIGAGEIVLGDTIGAATPGKIELLLKMVDEMAHPFVLKRTDGPPSLGLHLHDTFGRAADCVKTALGLGVRSFDGSVAGLGGCPYASTPGKRAPGNISTELLVRTVEGAGFKTAVNLDRLAVAADFARKIVAASRASSGGGAS